MNPGDYSDIINHPHHQSATRPRMSMLERAAQFSPFSALVGYDAEVEEAARLTDREVFLDEDVIERINETLFLLEDRISQRPAVHIRYFLPDEKKTGGSYIEINGKLKKIDRFEQNLVLTDGTKIPLTRVTSIEQVD